MIGPAGFMASPRSYTNEQIVSIARRAAYSDIADETSYYGKSESSALTEDQNRIFWSEYHEVQRRVESDSERDRGSMHGDERDPDWFHFHSEGD
jgi:hypothetical protein